MKLPTLEKFLCCMSLRTGGIVTGWLCIVISSVEFLSGTKSFILTVGKNINLVPHDGSPFAKLASVFWIEVSVKNLISIVLPASVIFFVLYVLYCALVIYGAWMLIEGAKQVSYSGFKDYGDLISRHNCRASPEK